MYFAICCVLGLVDSAVTDPACGICKMWRAARPARALVQRSRRHIRSIPTQALYIPVPTAPVASFHVSAACAAAGGGGTHGDVVMTVKDTTKTLPGGRVLFKDVNLSFLRGAKIGVVGLNGSGKSSLFRILARTDTQVPCTSCCNLVAQLSLQGSGRGNLDCRYPESWVPTAGT